MTKNDEKAISTANDCEPTNIDTNSWSYLAKRVMWRIKDMFHRNDPKESNLYKHALSELEFAGYFNPDTKEETLAGMNKLMAENVLELIETFAKQGHSGFSANFCVSLFENLAKYQPLGPLTGEDNEWVSVAEESGYPLYQNKRCGHVFKSDGKAYDIEGRIFREPNGPCFTNKDSMVYIEFPYTPKREYVDVPASEQTT